jgi:hypothetical protein
MPPYPSDQDRLSCSHEAHVCSFFFLKKKKELLSRLVVSHTRVHAMGSRAWRTPTSNAASSRDGKPFLAIRYVSTRHRVRIHYRERDMGRT